MRSLLMVFFYIIFSISSTAQNMSELRGRLNVVIADDFENNKFETLYMVEDLKTKKFFQINSKNKLPVNLKTGDIVRAKGLLKNNTLFIEGNSSLTIETVSEGASVEEATGPLNVLIVKLNFNDKTNPCSNSTLESRMFPTGDGNSVSELYESITSGDISFQGQISSTITIDYSSSGECSFSSWLNSANNAALNLGYDLNSYDRIIYHHPNATQCNWWGLGTIGGKYNWINGRCNEHDIFAHEQGHNFGMRHAGVEGNVYNDRSDFMGYSGIGIRELNAPHRIQQNWISSQKVLKSVGSGDIELAPLELSDHETSLAQVIQLVNPANSSEYFYFSYRQPIKYDSSLTNIMSGEYIKGLAIHTSSNGGATTKYIRTLNDGESFMVGTSLTLTQISHNASSVVIRISTDEPCYRDAPSVNLSPSTQASSPGDIESFNLEVRNNDAGGCDGANFNLNYQSNDLNLVSALPSTIYLNNGQSYNYTVEVSSSSEATTGTYSFEMGATHNLTNIKVADSASVLIETCTKASPFVSISPKSQNVVSGDSFNSTLTIKNNNSASCGKTAYSLDLYGDQGLTRTSSFQESVSLDPGAQHSQNITLSTTENLNGMYHFTFSAIDSVDGQYYAEEIGVAEIAPFVLSAPTGLSSKANKRGITLSWNSVVGASGYRVYRDGNMIKQVSDISYQDRNVTSSTTYTYHVTSIKETLESGPSLSLTITYGSSGGGKGGGKNKR